MSNQFFGRQGQYFYILLAIFPLANAQSVRIWQRFPGNSVTLNSVIVGHMTGSVKTCARASSNHTNFCYNVTTATCYVGGAVTSLTEPVPPEDSLHCYGHCPSDNGYTMYWGRCIKLYKTVTNYTQAMNCCAADGAHLYYLKSMDLDRQAANNIAVANGASLKDSFRIWLGADDISVEGDFKWLDGTLVNQSLWKIGEPNNRYCCGSTEGEDCVNFINLIQTLNDCSCSRSIGWVLCQIDL